MAESGRLNNLQVLRLVAAMMVVLHHVIATAETYGLPVAVLAPLTGWGEAGVDLFFVISGFVIVYTQATKPRNAGRFIYHRLARILPVYWLLSAMLLLLFLALPQMFVAFETSWQRNLASFLFLSSFVLREMPVLFIGWTLEYEMLFYALFALGLLLPGGRFGFLPPLLILPALVAGDHVRLIAFEFIFGMACAGLYLAGQGRWLRWPALGLGLLWLVGWIGLKFDIDRLWSFGLPALLIVFGAVNIRQIGDGLLTYLGDASYSIYLMQVFTIPVIYKLALKLPVAWPAPIVAGAAMLATMAAGCLLYELIEQPLLRRLRRPA